MKIRKVKLSCFLRKSAKKAHGEEMQNRKLSSKIRMAVHPQKLLRFPNKQWFYKKYATVVFRTLRKPLFQKFLDWMIKRENIEKNRVKDVQVRFFPFQKYNGNGLAGRCNRKGKILIYPKRLNFFRKQMRNREKGQVYFYVKSRAMATLIHELLHLKYLDDEDKVRELTRKYFNIFIQHQNPQNPHAYSIIKMLFPN